MSALKGLRHGGGVALLRLRQTWKAQRYRRRYGFAPPPYWSDITGYEPMLDVILERGLHRLDADFLEIGVFLGGGTHKLSNLLRLEAPDRRVVAIDVFDLDFDQTACTEGAKMAEIYNKHLHLHDGKNQREVFDRVTAGCQNLEVIAGDSTQATVPTDRLAFSFIDGHHASDYVRKDFTTAWERTVPAGVVALHDYGTLLPGVTHTVNALIGEHAHDIARVWCTNTIIFVQREPRRPAATPQKHAVATFVRS